MIQQISEYEYLGTSLVKFNSNMNELNVRMDNLYSQMFEMEPFISSFISLSADLLGFTNLIASLSGNWKMSADLVYNLRGYWEAPILISYSKTFNCIANYLEIQTWLNENFPSSNFSPTQIIRCDFLCKNYSSDALASTRVLTYQPETMESLANAYNTTVDDVFNYLGYKNQLEALLSVFNFLLRKYNKTDLILESIDEIENITNLVIYNFNSNLFESSELNEFSQTDLIYFHSYVSQYNNIKPKYDFYVSRNLNDIPQAAINQFEPRNVYVNSGGSFFYRIVNGKWVYHFYTGSEYCASANCNDCFDSLPVNELYGEKDCPQRFKYLLTECEFTPPYTPPYVEPMMLSLPVEDGYNIIDHLFS